MFRQMRPRTRHPASNIQNHRPRNTPELITHLSRWRRMLNYRGAAVKTKTDHGSRITGSCDDVTVKPCKETAQDPPSLQHAGTLSLPSFAAAVDPLPQPVAARFLLD